ncbi:HK97 gp10 family phage protein [Candidatus Methanomassiliicoccus intestinalis]|uniref:HK97 gp10 family phage protein n=1 Tax=Candidatus Methanomassiliicoccus intestinalis TaxID=1406512 RepID=UPI0037DC0EA7
MDALARAVAAKLLANVVNLTPVGLGTFDENGRRVTQGGTLRRGWSVEKISSGRYSVINPVPYALYVEEGHRQTPGRYVPAIGRQLKTSWVPGKHMLNDAIAQTKKEVPQICRELSIFTGGRR